MDILLKGVVGSTAYGLATPESDVDYMGVFLEPRESFLGLRPFDDKDSTVHRTGTEEDITIHELGKFMRLALKSNPAILEMLWLPEYTETSQWGDFLLDCRHWFASAELVKNAYLGYATQQFKLLERRGDFGPDMKKRTEKHARHLYRLLIQGYDLYRTGELNVVLDKPWKVREFGEYVVSQSDGLDHARHMVEYYEAKFRGTTPGVRDLPNEKAANNLLIEIRRNGYR